MGMMDRLVRGRNPLRKPMTPFKAAAEGTNNLNQKEVLV